MSYAGYYTVNAPASPASSWGTVSTNAPAFANGVNAIFGRLSIDIAVSVMHQVPPEILSEQAFTPPLSYIVLRSGNQGEFCQPVQNPSGITVQDLLTGTVNIYYNAISHSEASNLPHTTIIDGRHSTSITRPQAYPSKHLLRRVDLVPGHTRIFSAQLSSDRTQCYVHLK
ncbi:hypothetical protein AGABI1DRAFT_132660 [Agaricus bisporus var. burnettii JB137-S8]|uniref:DUF6699 domain-containing protein n=2 Tax=Agaricus bisporus var. burnettii TaxID=192524 RepID=K5WID6_AGABU|nr:uncharacterized protein AGABI1DRAFT_132660 [Agaricus bisporus var. burnettii JB137-S8]EKM75041.1 hypothetical protein AGABI1DRAFT_132660 [Agaricus bisporus var. burnettii JB137-S8]KAF7763731.1 hypothetical protein Agabi119p4_8268 [Agaricus bisporus var. burnettii]